MGEKGPVTTHILDTALGRPARGVPVTLEYLGVDGTDAVRVMGQKLTNADGRIIDLLPSAPAALGVYRLTFDTAAYFAALGQAPAFFPSVQISFRVSDATHYHVPLLISPFSYSTYRGS